MTDNSSDLYRFDEATENSSNTDQRLLGVLLQDSMLVAYRLNVSDE